MAVSELGQNSSKLTRRQFVRTGLLISGVALTVACAPQLATPSAPTAQTGPQTPASGASVRDALDPRVRF